MMDSALMDSQRNLRSMQVQCSEPVHTVQTHSQTKGLQAYDSEMVATVTATKGRNRIKYGRMGHWRGNPGKKFPTREGVGVPRTGMGTQASPISPGTPEREQAPSREKSWALPYSMWDLEEETNGGPRYQPSDEVAGEGSKASWIQICSLKPCNPALMAVLGVPEIDWWCAVPQVL